MLYSGKKIALCATNGRSSLGGKHTKTLVDSGAHMSWINERFLNVTSFRNYQAQKSMVKSIIGAGGLPSRRLYYNLVCYN
jgi:hypothetical protein